MSQMPDWVKKQSKHQEEAFMKELADYPDTPIQDELEK